MTESTAQGARARSAVLPGAEAVASGLDYWSAPFGAVSAANWLAPMAGRHFHDYGTTREQLGAVAVTQRAYTQSNPNAVLTKSLTLDDYLAVR